ncbi:hypothetical protein HanRHA438_Chr07g0293161 [Helianthus annuus]|nr:hypothetical protein HanRHA438_Chr07g0293161 [Helianthus annuus]
MLNIQIFIISQINLVIISMETIFYKTRSKLSQPRLCQSRAVNEPNVQRTVREPFGGKFVYVRSISLTNEHKRKILFGKLSEQTRSIP